MTKKVQWAYPKVENATNQRQFHHFWGMLGKDWKNEWTQSQVFPTLIEKWHLGSSNLIKLNFATGSHIARLSIVGSITVHSHSNTWTLSTQQCSNTWTPDTQQCSNSTYPIKTHIEVTQYHIKWFEENVAQINKRSQGGTPPLGIICIKLTKLMHWRTGSWVET